MNQGFWHGYERSEDEVGKNDAASYRNQFGTQGKALRFEEKIAGKEEKHAQGIGHIECVGNDVGSGVVDFGVVEKDSQHAAAAQHVYPQLARLVSGVR